MKKIILSLAGVSLLLMSSCKTQNQYSVDPYFIDYKNYAENGFFITESNSVNFDYAPVGSVSITLLSGEADGSEKYVVKDYNDVYGNFDKVKSKKYYKIATPYDALYYAVEEAKKQGANGLINLSFEPVFVEGNFKSKIPGYVVSGMAIKR